MGRAEGLIAIGISWQLLVLTLVMAGAFATPSTAGLWLSAVGFVIVAVGAWLTAWSKTIEG